MNRSQFGEALMNVCPLVALMSACATGAIIALLTGAWAVAIVFAMAALGARVIQQRRDVALPTIVYLAQPVPAKPLIRLGRGETAVVPRADCAQVLLPEGVRLKILEATRDRIRVIAE